VNRVFVTPKVDISRVVTEFPDRRLSNAPILLAGFGKKSILPCTGDTWVFDNGKPEWKFRDVGSRLLWEDDL
jgi:hypothetical protein